jgi:hypothetical protein
LFLGLWLVWTTAGKGGFCRGVSSSSLFSLGFFAVFMDRCWMFDRRVTNAQIASPGLIATTNKQKQELGAF